MKKLILILLIGVIPSTLFASDFNRGVEKLRAGHYKNALRHLSIYSENNPDNGNVLYFIGQIYYLRGMNNIAIDFYERAIRKKIIHFRFYKLTVWRLINLYDRKPVKKRKVLKRYLRYLKQVRYRNRNAAFSQYIIAKEYLLSLP